MWLSFRSPSFILLFLELSYFIIFLCSIYFPKREALCWEEKEVITLKTEIQLSSLVGCTEHRGLIPVASRADPLLGSRFLVLLSSFPCRRISSEDSPTSLHTIFHLRLSEEIPSKTERELSRAVSPILFYSSKTSRGVKSSKAYLEGRWFLERTEEGSRLFG